MTKSRGECLLLALVAKVRLTEADEPDQDALRLVQAIPNRRNDRYPFSAEPVSQDTLATLQASADGEGVHLQVVTRDEHRIWLSVLTERAAALRGAEVGYADELATLSRFLLNATEQGLATGVQSQTGRGP